MRGGRLREAGRSEKFDYTWSDLKFFSAQSSYCKKQQLEVEKSFATTNLSVVHAIADSNFFNFVF